MEKLDVIVWFNEQNIGLSAFVNPFIDDLQKCFLRFGHKVNLQTNPKEKTSGYNLIVLSEVDGNSESYFERVKGVLKDPNSRIVQIEPLKGDIGAENIAQPILFWDKQFITDEIWLLRRDSIEAQARYWEKVIDIVVDFLGSTSVSESTSSKEYIYLSIDQISINAERENIKRDLNDLGFTILPSSSLSKNIKDSGKQVVDALKLSRLIMHIIPPTYNVFFVNEKLSLTEHQCSVSAEFVKNADRKPHRIIWIPSAYEITDEENQVFVEKIQRDETQTKDTVILKSSIEDLKKYYRQVLEIKSEAQVSTGDDYDIYLISDNHSNGLASEALKAIESKGNLVGSNINGVGYNKHMGNLAKAKSLVICYSQTNEEWIKVKINEILKSKGMDNSRPFEHLILYKGDKEIDTEPYDKNFTSIIYDNKELTAFSFS